MTRKPQSKPFLVLPLLEDELLERHSSTIFDMPMKNPGLHLFTRTWPANKNSKDSNENKRPLTATLEKPAILDIRLIGKIDMSKIRKEFLNISNLCRMPLLIKKTKHTKQRRPLSLPPTDIEKKRKKIVDTDDVSVTEEESTRSVKVTGKHASKLGKINRNKAVNACDTNNNHSKHLRTPRNNVISIPSNDTKSTKLPQPCNSCGRPDQPERLHSHPVTPSKVETSPKIQVKNTVQKPIAIKYKSKSKPKSNESIPSPTRKYSLPTQNLVHSNPSSATEMSKLERGRNTYKKQVSSYRAASAKRTLTCYICGREYGTHSLHLHEPKCLEKWERENSLLPVQLQRKAPIKPPTDGKNKEDWNNLAWEAAQASLVPCKNCHRTFYPDRLMVHLRSCKPRPKTVNNEEIDDPLLLANSVQAIAEIRANPLRSQPINGRIPQQNWQCYICKKKFSSQTIKEHEKICMNNWRKMNEANYPTGANNALIRHKVPEERQMVQSEGTNKDSSNPTTPKTPPLFPCYLCGKLFSVNSIYIHEAQCLKKWKAENDKLPPNKRKQIPQKQEIKFTQEGGKINYAETLEANWQSHLNQLVACKYCKRTFNPDRVEIHERSCRGT